MSKIYQKMYLKKKSPAKSVLGGFIHNVILRGFYSESHPLSFNRAGFTLIELLVVVLIIGILAAVALPQYQTAVMKTRYSELMSIVHNLKNAEEVFLMANGNYTQELDLLDISFPITGYAENTGYEIAGKIHCQLTLADSNELLGCWRTPYMGYTVSLDKGLPAKIKYCFANDETIQVCRSMGGTNPTEYREGYWRFYLE